MTAKERAWKRAFYPISAKALVNKLKAKNKLFKLENKLAIIDHAIRKWLGAKSPDCAILYDTDTCSLCVAYYTLGRGDGDKIGCECCPIYQYRDGVTCFNSTSNEPKSPYASWAEDRNPQPMINLLKETRDFVILNNAKKRGVY